MENICFKIKHLIQILFICFTVVSVSTGQNNWLNLEASEIANQQILVTISLPQYDFENYISNSNVSSVQIELYSKTSGEGTLINMLSNDVLLSESNNASDVNVASWSLVVDGGLINSGDQLAGIILENNNACNDPFILNPTPYSPPSSPMCSSTFEDPNCSNNTPLAVVAGNVYTFNGLDITVTNPTSAILNIPFGGFGVEVAITTTLMANQCNEIVQGAVSASAAGGSNLINTTYGFSKKSQGSGPTVDICLPPPPPPAEDEHPGVNPDALDYINNNTAYIEGLISMVEGSLGTSVLTDITTKSGQCDSIRIAMDAILNNAANNLTDIVSLIKGESPDFKYFNEGLSNHFSSEPSLPINSIERDTNIKTLESCHVDLYNCDFALQILNEAADNVSNLPSNYIDIILYQISLWTGYQYELFTTNEEAFKDWIKDILIEIVAGELVETGNLRISDDPVLSFLQQDNLNSQLENELQEVFALETRQRFEPTVIASDKKGNLVAIRNQFKQSFKHGDPLINGIDRIYYEKDIADVGKQLKSMMTGLSLPLSLTNQNSSKPYDIVIENITVTAGGGAFITAALLIEDPKSGCDIIFRGTDLGFGPAGFASDSDSKLELGSDIVMRLNNAAALHLLAHNSFEFGTGAFGTHVTWDCYGFKEISVDSQVEFCPDFVKKINADDTVNEEENYKLGVNLQISDWNNFRIAATAPDRFTLTKYETIIWSVNNIVLDFSTSITEPNAIFEDYESPFMDDISNTLENEWEGFYVDGLSATIPAEFTGDVEGGGNDFAIAVDLAVIDDTGFSGEGSVSGNLIDIGEGNLNGWAFSVDYFGIKVVQNEFAGTSFAGDIQLPILNDPLEYTANVFPDDIYEFTVGNINASYSELFNAEINLSNSQVTIAKDELGFLASAELNGAISFDPGSTSNSSFAELNLPNLEFENLTLQNRAPYFNAGNWSTDGSLGASLGGFSLALNNVSSLDLQSSSETGLGFEIDLVINDNMNIAANGSFGIIGNLNYINGRQKWIFDRFEMYGLAVDAPIGAVAHITGGVQWTRDNPDWGNYFRGAFEVELKKVADITITGIGQFGKLNSNKYFYVDLMSSLPVDIPAGPIQFNALGLGLYRNMTYDNSNVNITNLLASAGTDVFSLINQPGTSLSPGTYSVQAGIDFGIKGIAQFKAANEKLLNGSISLGAQFTGTTIDKLFLDGTVQFLADLNNDLPASAGTYGGPAPLKPGSSDRIPLAAYAAFEMDFGNNVFTGDLGAYLNAGPLEGVGNQGALVLGKIHFGPDAWYVKMGKPTDPAGIRLNLAPVGEITATSYFQMGTDTDPIAEVPEEIRALAYTASRNQSLLTTGQGIVAGAKLEVNGGIGVDGLVSVNVHALAGFDVMLRNYEGVSCSNGANAGDPIGINGWYATGQLYALLEGSLSVLGVNILSAGVAALIQAQMPNPFFADATVGVSARIGFINVNKSLTLTLGEACILQADSPAAIFGAEVISSITPGQDEQEVSILSQPVAQFNFPLNRNFTMPSLNGGTSTFRVDLESVAVSGFASVYSEIANDGMSLNIFPYTSFPENEEVTITVSVQLYENGDAIQDGIQTKEVTFVTGSRVDNIPMANVKYAYPYDGMEYYYKNQYNSNFIELYAAQNYLFNGQDVKAILTSRAAAVPLLANINGDVELPVTFNASLNRILYQIPSSITDGEYKIEFIQLLPSGERNILHTINFGVSEYATFSEKMQVLESNFISSQNRYFFPGEEKFGINEREELLTATFGISPSIEYNFLSQFDQFSACFECFSNVNTIIDGYEVNGINIARGIIVTYEKEYRSLYQQLKDIRDECIGEVCDSPIACESGIEGDGPITGGCDISVFSALPSGTYPLRITYSIPGGSSYLYTIHY